MSFIYSFFNRNKKKTHKHEKEKKTPKIEYAKNVTSYNIKPSAKREKEKKTVFAYRGKSYHKKKSTINKKNKIDSVLLLLTLCLLQNN